MPDHTPNRGTADLDAALDAARGAGATATLGAISALGATLDAALGVLGEAERALIADLRRLATENARLHARVAELRLHEKHNGRLRGLLDKLTVECPACGGGAGIHVNPPLAGDPQQECPVECPSCHGDGVIPTGRRDDDFRGRPVPSTPPDTAGFVGDTVDFSGDPADPADYPF